MKVLWDNWREYTEREKRLIEELLREPHPMPKLILGLRRSKGYITQVRGGSADMKVSLEEVFRKRRLEVKVSDREYVSNLFLSLSVYYLSLFFDERGVIFERPMPDRCEMRFEDFYLGDGKRLTMSLINYHPYTYSVGEWRSVRPHYGIWNAETGEKEVDNINNLNFFASKLVRKAFDDFDLLLQGKAEEWLENWTGELKSLLQENIKQSKPLRR